MGVLTVLGARGSMPVSGASTARYGGRSTSFHVDGAGEPVIFDCGTGLALSDGFGATGPQRFHIFLSHYHLDHLIGLHMFRPLFEEGHQFVFYGSAPPGTSLAEAVAAPFAGSLFPVDFAGTPSEKSFVALDVDPVTVGDLTITPFPLHHPQGATGYRIDRGDNSVVIVTDHEAGDDETDRRIVDAAAGAGTMIHDAQYTPEEMPSRLGWGHSTWEHATTAASAAGVDRLVLTSHDPLRSDDAVDAIVARAASRFPNVAAAYEGMTVPL